MNQSRLLIPLAVAFEGGLGVVGCALAWWFAVPLGDRLEWSPAVGVRSLAALVPMLAFLAFAIRSRWPPLEQLRRQVEELARDLFGRARWWELLVVALAAGVGEELLFRGALQPLAERWLGAVGGLTATSIVFGAMHAASATYFVLATGVGLYLGWLAQHYDDLLAPMFVHAAYDWAALVVLLRGSITEPAAGIADSEV